MKFRVADIVDKDYTEFFKHHTFMGTEFIIETHTEHTFPKIDTPRGKKAYKADILLVVYKKDRKESYPHYPQFGFNVEIDLEKGHWSTWNRSKNSLRDEMLKEKFGVSVRRLNGYWLKKMADNEIMDYIKEGIPELLEEKGERFI